MKFGDTPLDEAAGAILAHSVRGEGFAFKKGRVLSPADVARLATAGFTTVVTARLEPADMPEDEAAATVARAVAGSGLAQSAAFTGRCNLYAVERGLAVIDAARLDRLNLVDEAVTIATLAPFAMVEPRQMVATIKIIPFAAPVTAVRQCQVIAAESGPLIRLAPLKRKQSGLIQTLLPGLKPSVVEATVATTRARLAMLGSELKTVRTCPHDAASVAAAVAELEAEGCDPMLILGASAIPDRRDVSPAAILARNGEVIHFGMPVDPGNLLLLGRVGPATVVGLPGCARSPKFNGFDWVLQRLLADLPIARADIMRMGAGGLLSEIPSRPLPRGEAAPDPSLVIQRAPRIAAIVLAAGRSTRMGTANKLVAEIDGRAMVAHAVDAALASHASPVVVVVGHDAERVRRALGSRSVTIIENPGFAEGLSGSLRTAIEALPSEIDGAVVLLGDMPRVMAAHIDRLIAAFNPLEGRAICVATHRSKRGNPVVWASRYFAEMRTLTGDKGARQLLGEHAADVCEVEMADDGVLADVDTPEALAGLIAGRAAEA